MGRKYANSPIVEALCEFQFESDSAWDLAIPGLVYEQVRSTFPKRRQAKAHAISISANLEGIEQQTRSLDRMQFLREDEKALIQVGPRLLAINHLKPYPSWSEFSPLIQRGLDAYKSVATVTKIHRIGLRYINRIEIASKRIDLEDYFEFRPFVGSSLSQEMRAFVVGIQISYEGERDILKIEMANAATGSPDSVAIILDLDYFLARPGEVPAEKALEWVDRAHTHVEETFEACITPRLRALFQEVDI
jgi:uncharacterized protein (TIGR04255 family)